MEVLWTFLFEKLLGLFQFWVIIDPYERGWLFRLGKPIKFLDREKGWWNTGFYLIIPFGIDEVTVQSVTEGWAELGVQSLVTKSGSHVSVQGTYRYKVLPDAEKILAYILEFGDEEKGLKNAFEAAIALVVEASSDKELSSLAIRGVVLDAARAHLNRYGLKIYDFEWVQRAFCRSIRVMWN